MSPQIDGRALFATEQDGPQSRQWTAVAAVLDRSRGDDASGRHSDRKNWDSDSDDENSKPIQIEFRFISGEEACSPMSLKFDPGLSCGHLWWHLLVCGLDMENKKLAVGSDVVDMYMKIALHPSVRKQLQATPGVLRITVVHSS